MSALTLLALLPMLAQAQEPAPAPRELMPPQIDLLLPAVVNRVWLAPESALGLGAVDAFGHVGPALDRWGLTLIGDGERPPLGYALSGWSTLWLAVPPGSHQMQFQVDLRSENGVGLVLPGVFRGGASAFAVANVLSWRLALLSDGQGGPLAFDGWSAGMFAYTPNVELGVTGRRGRFFALLGVEGGATFFWGDGQLATHDDAGQERRGQTGGFAAATAVAEARLWAHEKLRVAAELCDTPQPLPAGAWRHIVFGRAAVWVTVRHLVLGVEGWLFTPSYASIQPDWLGLATLGFSAG